MCSGIDIHTHVTENPTPFPSQTLKPLPLPALKAPLIANLPGCTAVLC